MESETSSIVKMIQRSGESPLEHDELINAWNSLCRIAWINDKPLAGFSDIENAAISTLTDASKPKPSSVLGEKADRLLDAFPHATYMVGIDGRVSGLNTDAFIKYDLTVGDKIDKLPFDLAEFVTLSSIVLNIIRSSSGPTQATLHKVHGRENNNDATLAISPSPGAAQAVLIFVITKHWQESTKELLKRQFKLSNSESDVLSLFVEGYSGQEIASRRSRSLATIRTQMQSILVKTYSRNQTELLRTCLSVSDFVTDIGAITDVLEHPYRRNAQLFVSKGRIVEVTIMGDFTGSALLHIPNGVVYTFNAAYEQALYQNKLFVISICPPGYGETDTVWAGAQRIECLEHDVVATLNHLNVNSCPIIATVTSSPVVYELASLLPHRISHIFQVGACPPVQYASVHGTESTWADAILKAGRKYSGLQKYLLKGGLKAWTAIGSKQFMRLQLSGNKNDLKYLLKPENSKELEHALKTATKYGISSLHEDSFLAFGDWKEYIEASEAKVTIIHGVLDTVFPIESIRMLVNDYPDKMSLVEVDGAGFGLNYSCPKIIVDQFMEFYRSENSAKTLPRETHVIEVEH